MKLLATHVPEAKRLGTMCPFIPGAIKHNSLYIKVIRFPREEIESFLNSN